MNRQRRLNRAKAQLDAAKARKQVNDLREKHMREHDPVKKAELQVKLTEARVQLYDANKVLKPPARRKD